MPILGTGIVPGGQQGQELQYITRRAFIPELIVSAYQATPTLAAALANSKTAMGGISGVTVPVQGAALVTTQWSGFAGTFNQPAYQQGIWNIEFNLALAITPIAFVGPEALVQDEHAVIPRIHAVMNDATNNMVATFSSSLFNSTGSDPTQWQGLPCAIDDGTNAATYGGLSRTTYPWLQSPVTASMGAAATRLLVLRNIARVYAGPSPLTQPGCGELPNFGVCGVATWYNLASDYINNEAFRIMADGKSFDQLDRGAQSGFMAVTVGGVPIYADLNCPEGTLYLWNTNYLALYLHHRTRFDFTGFYSTMGNWQLGFVGAVCTAGQLVNAKPTSCGRFSGYTYPTL